MVAYTAEAGAQRSRGGRGDDRTHRPSRSRRIDGPPSALVGEGQAECSAIDTGLDGCDQVRCVHLFDIGETAG